jgi:hypothetical protein
MGGVGLVFCEAEFEIGVVFVGAFSFLAFTGRAARLVVVGGDVFDGEGGRAFAAEDLDSALGVYFLQALFFGGFFCGSGGFIALDFGDVVLVVDVPGLLA